MIDQLIHIDIYVLFIDSGICNRMLDKFFKRQLINEEKNTISCKIRFGNATQGKMKYCSKVGSSEVQSQLTDYGQENS